MRIAGLPFVAVVVIAVFTLCEPQAYAMRCGTQLVRVGDSTSDVRAKCGEPTEISVWYESIPGWKLSPYDMESYKDAGFPGYRYERWTYNFGSSQFIRYLDFRDGKLITITKGDYGY